METSRAGELGWLGLGVGVLSFDIIANETLSHAFQRGIENPKTRYLVIGAWALTTAHLCHVLPDTYDPFKRSVDYLKRAIQSEE